MVRPLSGVGRWLRRHRTRSGPQRLAGLDGAALLDACSDAVIVADENSDVVFLNAAAQRVFGYGPGELTGLPVRDIVPGIAAPADLTPAIDGPAEPGATGGQPCTGVAAGTADLRGVRRDGSQFPAAVWLTPVRDGSGLLVAVTVRDLSERRRIYALVREAESDLRHAQDVIAAVLAAVTERVIVLADRSGRITALNRAGERLLGYRSEELIGQPTLILSDPDEVAAAQAELGLAAGADPLLEVARSGLPNLQEWSYRTKSGQRRRVSLKVSSIGDRQDPAGFVCVASELSMGWQPMASAQTGPDRLLLELDDAPTRALRWQVGGSGYPRRGERAAHAG